MPVLASVKRHLFWIVSRTCFALYRRFPLFGSLRASIAIIQRDGKFLVIERNDGRGLSLPGGISAWKETEVDTMVREVREETGLNVTAAELRMSYSSTTEVASTISVFEARADGDLRNSWEGFPRWMTAAELAPGLLRSQRPVLELLAKMGGGRNQPRT